MKRALELLIVILCIFSLCLSSCGEYVSADPTPEIVEGEGDGGDGSDNPDGGDDSSKEYYTVTLSLEGKKYVPVGDMYAQWSNGFSYHKADFDENGKARIEALDGDFTVTVHGLPVGITYNPNIYVATAYDPDVEINLYKINLKVKGTGTNAYNPIELSSIGVYTSPVYNPNGLFYCFAPTVPGKYSIETWVDCAANEINPKIDIYSGSFAAAYYQYTVNDGGSFSSYTKNAKFEVQITEAEIGNVFIFAIKADMKEGNYPCMVDFALSLNGSPEERVIYSNLVIPTEDFVQTPEYSKSEYKFVYPEIRKDGFNLFDASRFKLFSKDEDINGDGVGDGDGYYHLFDETKYSENGGYGPILYASITSPCRFYKETNTSFTTIEYEGNKALTINGTENHKLFIEGLDALLVDPPSLDIGPYMCILGCPCRESGSCVGVCAESCERCLDGCRKLSQEVVDFILEKNGAQSFGTFCLDSCKCNGAFCYDDCTANCCIDCYKMPKQFKGYRAYCNSDGVYAVTQELKDFLQGFSVSQSLFRDGEGFVETHPIWDVDADEDSQWLFACGYYEKISE